MDTEPAFLRMWKGTGFFRFRGTMGTCGTLVNLPGSPESPKSYDKKKRCRTELRRVSHSDATMRRSAKTAHQRSSA